jgi:plasmid stabilization system protein ParE
MGDFQLRLTSQAARDLQEIVSYIARDNPAAAERFGLALVEKAELLKTFPMLGKKVTGTKEDRVLVQAPILIFINRTLPPASS